MKYLLLIAQEHCCADAMAITVVCFMLLYKADAAYFVNETPHQSAANTHHRIISFSPIQLLVRFELLNGFILNVAMKTKEYIHTNFESDANANTDANEFEFARNDIIVHFQ